MCSLGLAASQAACGAQTGIREFLTGREKLEHSRQRGFPGVVWLSLLFLLRVKLKNKGRFLPNFLETDNTRII